MDARLKSGFRVRYFPDRLLIAGEILLDRYKGVSKMLSGKPLPT